MVNELRSRGPDIGTMAPVALYYKGALLHKDYIIDLFVENEIILELKAVEGLLKIPSRHSVPPRLCSE